MNNKVDIIIPTYNRLNFLKNCIRSIHYNTRVDYRLFIVDDCSDDGTQEWLATLQHPNLEEVILNKRRRGLTYGFNILGDIIRGTDWYYNSSSRYMVLMQPDTEVMVEGWLKLLIKANEVFKDKFNIGFFSGHDAPEHPTILEQRMIIEQEEDIFYNVFKNNSEYSSTDIDNSITVKIKKSMRATCMIATWFFWDSIGKIPKIQPNGTERGFPTVNADGSKGKGSNLDLFLTGYQSKGQRVDLGRTTIKSSGYQEKTCMVIPGLVEHKALEAKDSTWGNKNVEY